jgi:hypothetical protein
MLELKPHEEQFKITPVGIRYICEFCNDGEMRVDTNGEVKMTNPPLIPHKCTKCGKTMYFNKQYPYIEWVPEDEEVTE